MPIVKRCCVCGRVADNPHDARPYKDYGYACDKCYISHVVPSKKWKESKYNKYGKRQQ